MAKPSHGNHGSMMRRLPPSPSQNKRKHLSVFNGLLPLGVLALVTTWPSMYRFMKYLNVRNVRIPISPPGERLENSSTQKLSTGICDRSQEGSLQSAGTHLVAEGHRTGQHGNQVTASRRRPPHSILHCHIHGSQNSLNPRRNEWVVCE